VARLHSCSLESADSQRWIYKWHCYCYKITKPCWRSVY